MSGDSYESEATRIAFEAMSWETRRAGKGWSIH